MTYPHIPEPAPDHLADTGPSRPVRADRPLPVWRRMAGLLSLLGALALTVGAAAIILSPVETPPPSVPPAPDDEAQTEVIALPTALPTTPVDAPPAVPINPQSETAAALPTLSFDEAVALLATPIAPHNTVFGFEIVRSVYNPFTIVPDRPRSGMEQYEVQPGDTIFQIAERFGLQPESIAWANDRSIIGRLRPGQRINIMPIDGAYHTVISETTIRQLAARYRVDPYAIIDSPFNDLFGAEPDDPLPVGSSVVIPGGVAEVITWTPRVERVESGSGASGGVARISFAVGEPGSCGLVDNPGGGGGWVRPLNAYTWTRGFTSYHTGVDLSAPTGTPVVAANGGTVIFSGWNSFGYGETIVLAHGPFTTLYGHLSARNVSCGQRVGAGQVIGAVGSTGNSSGPHLHFEIRYNDVPTDPTGTMAF